MKLNQIKKVRVYEQVIEQIKVSVEEGYIQPGDKLPSERELAVQLSVSRSVIREAMSVLNASGVLDIRPGIGVFLAEDEAQMLIQRMNGFLTKSSVNLMELLEVRQGLEGQAAYLAAERATEEDLEKLNKALKQLEKAAARGMVAANEDFAFHAAIVSASKNETIIDMIQLLSDRFLEGLNESRSQSLLTPHKAEKVIQEHYEIYQAIIERDSERAREMMLRHIQNVKDSYEQHRREGIDYHTIQS
ncbi:FadR/GntR family transcriptional regulator [Aneurinibacillus tyrosinisolvens]|uniref:FadR/GntR family transcriptional regulator n=1 Tax=Aneurinibacillus tyrosinisolvens TaxID=1443435 RepID=UPI00063FAD05|nr:FadR/GntR family transcriptional regulator [Aneurinibacillus tyrosinisolvens]